MTTPTTTDDVGHDASNPAVQGFCQKVMLNMRKLELRIPSEVLAQAQVFYEMRLKASDVEAPGNKGESEGVSNEEGGDKEGECQDGETEEGSLEDESEEFDIWV